VPALVALAALAAAVARCTRCIPCDLRTSPDYVACQQGCLNADSECAPSGFGINEGATCAADGGICTDGGCALP
jgi:hypothetical protein